LNQAEVAVDEATSNDAAASTYAPLPALNSGADPNSTSAINSA